MLGGVGAVGTTATAANPAVQLSSVSVSPEDPNTGERVTIDATISNLENSDTTVEVRDVYVRTPGTTDEYARLEEVGSIAPGGSLSIPISTTFESAGEKRLNVNVVVQDEDGDYHRYTYPVYVDVTEPNVRADLSSRTDADSGTTSVSLTNFGNADLSDVEITARVGGEVVARNFLFDVAPESNRTTTFDTDDYASETVRFVATYDAAGESHETTLSVELDDRTEIPGEIRLTAVETTRTGSGVTIEGDAANLGGTDAESVLVSVGDADGVRPASPSGEYFIGAIDASEFATFELTAAADQNASSVPVEIAYIVDNERVTTTQRVSIDGDSPSSGVDPAAGSGDRRPGGGPGDSGGLQLTVIGGVAVVVLVVGAGVYLWRR
ncbi:hypothetical protein DV707_07270 [Halobellus limi]|uniref:CARDB domain-containing protein n=1 Tax=Halobellus limi TaxID=699433 RepID=A0A4D6H4Q9_9EURY|nr:hypothetical protein DV707_07270 [Halobellus limi]